MKALSVGMMAVTFVLGVGAVSVSFLFGKAVLELIRDKLNDSTKRRAKCLGRNLLH